MGLANSSAGAFSVKKRLPGERVVALAGNPNVGKSTVFNALTGSNQHTGNWPGKTVECAEGRFSTKEHSYILVDLPGTYSLAAHSAEEETARDFICFGKPDAVVVVCDAACLERNLDLVLQTMEITPNVLVCVNLLDEARRRGVTVDIPLLAKRLGVAVVGTAARSGRGLSELAAALDAQTASPPPSPFRVSYPPELEAALGLLLPAAERASGGTDPRWLSLRLLERGEIPALPGGLPAPPELREAAERARASLPPGADAEDIIASSLVRASSELCRGAVARRSAGCGGADRRLDRLFTGRLTAYPVMILLLGFIFWLTIVGANYPSELLSAALFRVQDALTALMRSLGAPEWLHGLLVLGGFRVLAWVVSVMLPPMAIFFPLFTLLEDAGYLPRVAYNLDGPFRRCRACGKQALTMAMGFGCNAAGVVGCRIIDSPRERLLAVLTNVFVPCNGRFPALIAVTAMFFAAGGAPGSSAVSALSLTGVMLLGVGATLGMTKLLSATLLRGLPSSFTLELPPYRAPRVGEVIVRSIFDRTLFVLGRAAAVAAPAGMIIWLMANITAGGESLLSICAGFLDPFARLLGLDGVMLTAFILGFPANEIVLPIAVMAYMSGGTLSDAVGTEAMKALFISCGWTWRTAVSFVLFSLMHWPCSTALITIRRETGSAKWTFFAAAAPTALGAACCAAFTALSGLFS
jgi:ferrous iron transport protein B